MAIPILIIGKSGTGKSTSLRNFKKDDVGIINVIGKPLPFQNDLKTVHTDNYRQIENILLKSETDSIVIDDAGYLLTNYFMKGYRSKEDVFGFYDDLADEFWKLINIITNKMSKEKLVYIIMHEETNDIGEVKPKTIGKLLNEKVCIEGMCTIALRTARVNGEYKFLTQSNGLDICKSPMGMFESETIDNDLKMVDDTIRKYYKFDKKKGSKE